MDIEISFCAEPPRISCRISNTLSGFRILFFSLVVPSGTSSSFSFSSELPSSRSSTSPHANFDLRLPRCSCAPVPGWSLLLWLRAADRMPLAPCVAVTARCSPPRWISRAIFPPSESRASPSTRDDDAVLLSGRFASAWRPKFPFTFSAPRGRRAEQSARYCPSVHRSRRSTSLSMITFSFESSVCCSRCRVARIVTMHDDQCLRTVRLAIPPHLANRGNQRPCAQAIDSRRRRSKDSPQPGFCVKTMGAKCGHSSWKQLKKVHAVASRAESPWRFITCGFRSCDRHLMKSCIKSQRSRSSSSCLSAHAPA